MLLSVLLPDQGKRHVPALQILVDRRPVRLRTLGLRRRSAGRRIQPALQLLLAQTLPTLQQACPLHPRDVVRHARPPDSKRLTDLPLAQTAHQKQTQHLLDLPHTESPCRHLSPFGAQNVTASEPFSPLVPTASRPPFRRSSKSGRLHVGTVAAFVSEWVAAFASEWVAGFARNPQRSDSVRTAAETSGRAPTLSEERRNLPRRLRQCQSSGGSFRACSDSVRGAAEPSAPAPTVSEERRKTSGRALTVSEGRQKLQCSPLKTETAWHGFDFGFLARPIPIEERSRG